jgi:hypothetical protein
VIASVNLALHVQAIQDLIVVAAALFALGLWPGPFRFTRGLLEPTEADALEVNMPRVAPTPLLLPLEWEEESEASGSRRARLLGRVLKWFSFALPHSAPRRPV